MSFEWRIPESWMQRYRNSDPETSKDAAIAAKKPKASEQRKSILSALQRWPEGLTGKELSVLLSLDYHSVQRRISEVQGIYRNGEKRDGAAVWKCSEAV